MFTENALLGVSFSKPLIHQLSLFCLYRSTVSSNICSAYNLLETQHLDVTTETWCAIGQKDNAVPDFDDKSFSEPEHVIKNVLHFCYPEWY